jgi:hypothetical protein
VELAQFYQGGGFFMHILSVLGALATGALVRSVVERRSAAARGHVFSPSGLVPRLAAVIVLVGVLALVDGTMQLMAALQTVELYQWARAFARGGQLVVIPLGWALTIASTLLFADALLFARRGAH